MDILGRPERLLDDAPLDDREPQSLWAKLDHIDIHPSGYEVAVFDAVNADWFAAAAHSVGGFTRPDTGLGEHVSIVTLATGGRDLRQRWYRIELGRGRYAAPMHAWEIELRNAAVALQADSLLGLSTPRPIVDLRPATRAEAAALGAAGSMSDLADAPPSSVDELLADLPEATSVGVLDVGQGNWNVLLHRGCACLLYDLGGGVLAHLRSFPADFTRFCFAARPPVVLSHWDWDHWSSAARFPEAQKLTWIVPRQGSLGPTHARFLAALRAHGSVRVLSLPNGQSIGPSHARLQQATGPARSRNATGLALVVTSPCGRRVVLLPGDAGYANLQLPKHLTSLVVPHHGGVTRSSAKTLPSSDGESCGRAVISVGATSPKHPSEQSLKLHDGWGNGLLLTSNRGTSPNKGAHVELHWHSPATATPPCCEDSILPLDQR